MKEFVSAVHYRTIRPEKRSRFTKILTIGIGGSALDPLFISDALGTYLDEMNPIY